MITSIKMSVEFRCPECGADSFHNHDFELVSSLDEYIKKEVTSIGHTKPLYESVLYFYCTGCESLVSIVVDPIEIHVHPQEKRPKFTLITGDQGVGKTREALRLAQSKQYYKTDPNSLMGSFGFERCKIDVIDFLIVDEATEYAQVQDLLAYCGSGLLMDRQGKKSILVDMPEIIVVSQNLLPKDFPNRFKINHIPL